MSSFLDIGRWFARALIGLFVIWQFAFLIGLNFCQVSRLYLDTVTGMAHTFPSLASQEEAAHRTLAKFEQVATRWAELTGQGQSWSLFAPDVWYDIPFLAVEFRWDEEPQNALAVAGMVGSLAGRALLPSTTAWIATAPPAPGYLLSDNEPPDIKSYFKVGRFRLRRYESNLDMDLYLPPDKTAEEMEDTWRQRIQKKVGDEALATRAYLEWRLRVYESLHPEIETPPSQVILKLRIYRIPPPPGPQPWTWSGPDELPMVRWRPHVRYLPGKPQVEIYDLVAERFDVME